MTPERSKPEPDGFYTVPDFMRTFAVPRTSLYRAVQRGEPRLTKIGRSSRLARTGKRVGWSENIGKAARERCAAKVR